MLTMRYSDYVILPIMRSQYLPLLELDGGILKEVRHILLRHRHGTQAYPSKSNSEPVQQQRMSASPYDETLCEPPCVIPRANYITLYHNSAHHE